jgi:hypothetical protein
MARQPGAIAVTSFKQRRLTSQPHDTWQAWICEQYSAFTSTNPLLPKLALAEKR